MTQAPIFPAVDAEALRSSIRDEYAAVANDPRRGFHFHTGRPLARLLGYEDGLLAGVPEDAIDSMAGTGTPSRWGRWRRANG